MSSQGVRTRVLSPIVTYPNSNKGKAKIISHTNSLSLGTGGQITASESHPINRDTGSYDEGGPFFTSRVTPFANPGHVDGAWWPTPDLYYSGPVMCALPTLSEMSKYGYQNSEGKFGSKNESSLKKLGTTAISLSNPTNSASNLGVTLGEMFREGIPALPGVKSWRGRTQAAKAAGDEYLNYQFGWAPLVNEVHNVSKAARNHRDIMEQYHAGEGQNTRRTFEFPPSNNFSTVVDTGGEHPLLIGVDSRYLSTEDGVKAPKRLVSVVRETKRKFVGSFTYALPSSTDSWRKTLGFGSQADQLFGISLTPEILWELTPWSWAVDWFSNAGEVINNVTQFGLAGSVLRYGYMMEESIERITAEVGPAPFRKFDPKAAKTTYSTGCSCGFETVTKRRVVADPFGFSIGWEGLSPTQLAITAALGITKVL